MTWIMLGGFGLVFYFLLIRPQKKQKKEREQLMNALTKGARVVTIGGIVGTVQRVEDNEVLLLIDKDKKVHVKMLKSSIGNVLESASGEEQKKEEHKKEEHKKEEPDSGEEKEKEEKEEESGWR